MRALPFILSLACVSMAGACGSSGNPNDQGEAGAGHDAASDAKPHRDGAPGDAAGDGSQGGPDSGGSDGDCADGKPCTQKCADTPTLLASAQNVWDVALTPGYVVFVEPGGGTSCVPSGDAGDGGESSDAGCGVDAGSLGAIVRVPIHGGTAVTLATPANPYGLAIGGSVVVFGDQGGGIFTVPLGGGSTMKIADTNGPPSRPVTDGKLVYFADTDGVKFGPIGGGTVVTLVPSSTAPDVGAVALVGPDLLLTGDTTVWTVPRKGGSPTSIATGQMFPLLPLAAGSNPAWLNSGDALVLGAIMEEEKGVPTTIASSPGLTFPTAAAYDGTNFYVVTGAGSFGPVKKVSASKGMLSTVKDTSGSGGVAVDETCLYYGGVFTSEPGLYSVTK
jgi:hypothetical protein